MPIMRSAKRVKKIRLKVTALLMEKDNIKVKKLSY